MINIKDVLHQAIILLSSSPSAQIDAEILLAHTLGTSRTFLYTYPEKELKDSQIKIYQELVAKRSQGIPIAYLTGNREFWSLNLRVSPETLIPRPETELLVDITLTLLDKHSSASILDLGTGSGAIALALASERPHWHILACDINEAAVNIARQNAADLGLSNIQILHSDWFTAINFQQFNAIVSNPPYIAESDPHLKQGDLRFEPRKALASGVSGLESLSQIINQSYERLVPGGLLLLEHGFQQKNDVGSLLQENGYINIHCWQDLQGNDRVSGGWRASS